MDIEATIDRFFLRPEIHRREPVSVYLQAPEFLMGCCAAILTKEGRQE